MTNDWGNQPQPPPPPPGYGYQPQPGFASVPMGPQTNGKAVAALVCGILGFFLCLPSLPGIILGFIAKGEINRSQGRQTGSGMAIAGIVLGFVMPVVFVLLIVAITFLGKAASTKLSTVGSSIS